MMKQQPFSEHSSFDLFFGFFFQLPRQNRARLLLFNVNVSENRQRVSEKNRLRTF